MLAELRDEIVNRLAPLPDVEFFIECRQEFSDGVLLFPEGGGNGLVRGSLSQHREELQVDRRKGRWEKRRSVRDGAFHPRQDVGSLIRSKEGLPCSDRLYCVEEIFGPDIFRQVPVPAGHDGVIEGAVIAVGREEQDPHTGESRKNISAGIGPSAIGQAHIHDYHIRLGATDYFSGACPAVCLSNYLNATIQFKDGPDSLTRDG